MPLVRNRPSDGALHGKKKKKALPLFDLLLGKTTLNFNLTTSAAEFLPDPKTQHRRRREERHFGVNLMLLFFFKKNKHQ